LDDVQGLQKDKDWLKKKAEKEKSKQPTQRGDN
jgi:hypothetical protein